MDLTRYHTGTTRLMTLRKYKKFDITNSQDFLSWLFYYDKCIIIGNYNIWKGKSIESENKRL